LPLLRNALTQLEELGLRTRYYPIYLDSLAQGLGAAGHFTEAYSAIDTALAWINKHEEYWCTAELLRIKGELFRLEGSAAAAEDQYRRALEWAHRQNALSWELRAATSLAQLWRQNGGTEEAQNCCLQSTTGSPRALRRQIS
jgi:hypothetical protein